MFRSIWSSSDVKMFMLRKLLLLMLLYIGPLDAHMCLSWWVVSCFVFCAACLVLQTRRVGFLNCYIFKVNTFYRTYIGVLKILWLFLFPIILFSYL
jgi:hypothetical protein